MKNRPQLTLAALLVAACVIASACSASSDDASTTSPDSTEEASSDTESSATPASPSSNDGFKVIGKDIVDPNGNLFVPFGANVGAPVKDSEGEDIWLHRLRGDDITTPEAVAAVDEWGWNFLRVNAECRARPANDNNASWGNEEMFTALDEVIDLYTGKGIVVMVDCHNQDSEETPVVGTDQFNQISAFWESAAERYGDNSYVWFNHMNEFHKGIEPVDVWTDAVDEGYRVFAETGAQNLVLFDLPNFAQDLEIVEDPEFQEWSNSMCNVVWDWHSYGGITPPGGDVLDPDQEAFEAEVARLVDVAVEAEIAVVVGEIGYDWDSERKFANFDYEAERAGALAALKIAPENGYGVVIWHANGSSGVSMNYGLKTSDELTFSQPAPTENLSEMGELFLALVQEQNASDPAAGPTEESCVR